MTFKNTRILWIVMISACFGGRSEAQITEKDTTTNKQAVGIHLGYQTQPAWMVTSSTSTVAGKDLEKPFVSDFANTLYGRLAGLTVVQGSGEAGSDSPGLFARGLGTFGTGRAMLVLVDGFESMFEQLVPGEVESVTLLKDAAATAVYGSRGANGVLLITTKRGKEGPMTVNFSIRQGIESPVRLPDFLSSYDYAKLYNEALNNDGRQLRYTADDLEAYKTGSDPFFHPNVNWFDKLLRKAVPISEYNLRFSGGKKKARYFVLLNALNRSGLYEKTEKLSEFGDDPKYSQYNIRTNVDINLTKNLLVNFNLGVSIADKRNPVDYNTESIFDQMSLVPPNAFPIYNPNGSLGGNSLYSNPWGDISQTGPFTSNYRTFQSVLKFTEQLDMFIPGLSATAAASFNDSFRGYSSKSRSYQRFSISKDPTENVQYVPFGAVTSLVSNESQFDQWRNFTFQAFLNYNHSFGHNQVNAILGYDLDTYTLSGNNLPYNHVGANGRFAYAYREKYIGEFSFGYDGSENFSRGNRFGFFPAVSLGWVASKERFLEKNDILTFLKIRGSYGLVGNDNIGGQRFMYDQYYIGTAQYYFGTTNSAMNGYAEGSIANPTVTWESERKMNIGFEATILRRLNIGLDLFKQDRYNILASPNNTVPQFLGMTLPSLNVGKVSNKGFEIEIGYNSDQAKGFQYFVDLNTSYAKNKIVYNAETVKMNACQNTTGLPIDQPFLLRAIGFFKDQDDIDASPQQVFTKVQTGDIKYKDQNKDGIVDQNDYYPSGKPPLPELTLGLHTGLKYKGFDLDFFFQGVTGCSVYLTGNDFYAFQNNGKISSIALGRWTPETSETATYPRLSAENNLNNYQPSTFWQRDGSFIKLRSAELGFSLPQRIVEKVRLSNAKIFINGTNLFSVDHVDIADPETLTGYPAVRSVSIGAKIQF